MFERVIWRGARMLTTVLTAYWKVFSFMQEF